MRLGAYLIAVCLIGCEEKSSDDDQTQLNKPITSITPRAGRLSSKANLATVEIPFEQHVKKTATEILNSAGTESKLSPDGLAELLVKVSGKGQIGAVLVDTLIKDSGEAVKDETGRRLVDEILYIVYIVGSYELTEERSNALLNSAHKIAKHLVQPSNAPSSMYLKGFSDKPKIYRIAKGLASLFDLELDDATMKKLETIGKSLKNIKEYGKKELQEWEQKLENVRNNIYVGHQHSEPGVLSAPTEALEELAKLIVSK